MMSLLSDHGNGQANPENFETSLSPGPCICTHGNLDGSGGNTAASLVADLCADGSRLPIYWCSFYSPCLGLFFPIFLEGDLPRILANGSATPSKDSPWWLFHRLSHLARQDDTNRIPVVRNGWASFQNRLFNSAYQIAAEGRELIDTGRYEKAKQLLSDYMTENMSEMLVTVTKILQIFEGQLMVGY